MARTELEELVEVFTQPEVLQAVVDGLERPLARLVSQLEGRNGEAAFKDALGVIDDTMKELIKKLCL